MDEQQPQYPQFGESPTFNRFVEGAGQAFKAGINAAAEGVKVGIEAAAQTTKLAVDALAHTADRLLASITNIAQGARSLAGKGMLGGLMSKLGGLFKRQTAERPVPQQKIEQAPPRTQEPPRQAPPPPQQTKNNIRTLFPGRDPSETLGNASKVVEKLRGRPFTAPARSSYPSRADHTQKPAYAR